MPNRTAAQEAQLELLLSQKHDAHAAEARCKQDVGFLNSEIEIIKAHQATVTEARALVNAGLPHLAPSLLRHMCVAGKLAEAEALVQSLLTAARSDLDQRSNSTRHLYQQLQDKENLNTNQLVPPEWLAGTTMDFVITRSEVGYGFSVEGGHGLAGAAAISKVLRYGPSDIVGMKAGDVLLCVNDRDVLEGTHKEVVDLIRRTPQPLKLTIYRPNKQFDGSPHVLRPRHATALFCSARGCCRRRRGRKL